MFAGSTGTSNSQQTHYDTAVDPNTRQDCITIPYSWLSIDFDANMESEIEIFLSLYRPEGRWK